MAENKTQPTETKPKDFIAKLDELAKNKEHEIMSV